MKEILLCVASLFLFSCASTSPCNDPNEDLACWEELPSPSDSRISPQNPDDFPENHLGSENSIDLAPPCVPPEVFFNEILSNPSGSDEGNEFIELSGTPGTSLENVSLIGYNGSDGSVYFEQHLQGIIGVHGFTIFGKDGIPLQSTLQNGPDALELIACGQQLDLVVYGESQLLPIGTTTEIPEENASILWCQTTGSYIIGEPSPWEENICTQTPTCEPTSFENVVINEIFVDPEGADAGLEFIELAGPQNMELNGMHLLAINGNDGAIYGEIALDGKFDENGLFLLGTENTLPFAIQNGPDSLSIIACETHIDTVGYGELTSEQTALSETEPAALPPTGQSLSRDLFHTDTDNNNMDFIATQPSPLEP